MSEKKTLMHIKHTWMDVFRFPLLVEAVAVIIIIIAYFASSYQYGYFVKVTSWESFLFVMGFFCFMLVLFPGFVAYVIWRDDLQLDEWLLLEGDEIVLMHGDKEIFRGKAEALQEIWISYGGYRESYIEFGFNRKFGKYKKFRLGDGIALRKWIDKEEMLKKGFEFYNIFKKYNQNLKFKRWFKKVEIWNGNEWVEYHFEDERAMLNGPFSSFNG